MGQGVVSMCYKYFLGVAKYKSEFQILHFLHFLHCSRDLALLRL